jgi:hypothetical protein
MLPVFLGFATHTKVKLPQTAIIGIRNTIKKGKSIGWVEGLKIAYFCGKTLRKDGRKF